MENVKYFVKDNLQCFIYEDRAKMGAAAARDVLSVMKVLLAEKESVNMMFGAAPSQNEVLAGLAGDTTADWSRVNCFHMDEYIGLSADAPQGFGNFLNDHLFSHHAMKSIHYIGCTMEDPDVKADRYAELLRQNPIDICVLGVGENGHVAFNDPAVADFHDSRMVKPVSLDEICRQQQVNDDCFASLEDVPKMAVTVTVPALMSAKALFCVVPNIRKANAIHSLICGPVSEECPSSILRYQPCARLYLDPDSASRLPQD